MTVGALSVLPAKLPLIWDTLLWIGTIVLACWPVEQYDTAAFASVVLTLLISSFLVQHVFCYGKGEHGREASFRISVRASRVAGVVGTICAPCFFICATHVLDCADGLPHVETPLRHEAAWIATLAFSTMLGLCRGVLHISGGEGVAADRRNVCQRIYRAQAMQLATGIVLSAAIDLLSFVDIPPLAIPISLFLVGMVNLFSSRNLSRGSLANLDATSQVADDGRLRREAVESLLAEKTPLAPRERQTVAAAICGLSSTETASLLGVSPSTVRNSRANGYRKLGVSNHDDVAHLFGIEGSRQEEADRKDVSGSSSGEGAARSVRALVSLGCIALGIATVLAVAGCKTFIGACAVRSVLYGGMAAMSPALCDYGWMSSLRTNAGLRCRMLLVSDAILVAVLIALKLSGSITQGLAFDSVCIFALLGGALFALASFSFLAAEEDDDVFGGGEGAGVSCPARSLRGFACAAVLLGILCADLSCEVMFDTIPIWLLMVPGTLLIAVTSFWVFGRLDYPLTRVILFDAFSIALLMLVACGAEAMFTWCAFMGVVLMLRRLPRVTRMACVPYTTVFMVAGALGPMIASAGLVSLPIWAYRANDLLTVIHGSLGMGLIVGCASLILGIVFLEGSRLLVCELERVELRRQLELLGERRQRGYLAFRGLTDSQVSIVMLVAQGMTGAQISQRLHYAPGTINSARRRAYQILGVKNRAELVALLARELAE